MATTLNLYYAPGTCALAAAAARPARARERVEIMRNPLKGNRADLHPDSRRLTKVHVKVKGLCGVGYR